MNEWDEYLLSGRKYGYFSFIGTKITLAQTRLSWIIWPGEEFKKASFQSGLSFRKQNILITVKKFLSSFLTFPGLTGWDLKIREGRRDSRVDLKVPCERLVCDPTFHGGCWPLIFRSFGSCRQPISRPWGMVSALSISEVETVLGVPELVCLSDSRQIPSKSASASLCSHLVWK